jgi:K+-sensing histidine kinase KdpD
MSITEATEALYRVMNEDRPFEEKARRALELAEQQLDVDNAHLTKIHPEGEYWTAVASTDPPDGEFPPGLTLDLQNTYCRRVVDEEQSIALDDAPNQGWGDDPAFQEHGLHCYHGSPLKIDDETYGTVCFVSKTPRQEPFTEEETLFAELVARLLEHELQRERTDARIERLEEFASVLSHDIRGPLTVAIGRIEIAREQHDGEHLREADEALERMDALISDVLAMAQQGQRIESTDEVELSRIATDCWETVASDRASLTVEGELHFRAAEDRVRRVFESLYRNATEHGGETVTVRVGPLADGDGFYVEDNGPGIPEDEREAVRRATYTTGDGNLGLGLAIVESITTAHDWDLTVTESATGGTRFEFSNVIVADGAAHRAGVDGQKT